VAAAPLAIPSLARVPDFAGVPLGPSDWVTVTQECIDAFAALSGDRQWIHCDVERAARESPWKSTVAHGYLSLALVPRLLAEIVSIGGCESAVNAGLERLRFSAPVPAGARVRLHAEIAKARGLPRGGVRVSFALRLEVEGAARPALAGQVHYVYLPATPRG
jgi:acyl dehydratase